jgi:hypothetical protein
MACLRMNSDNSTLSWESDSVLDRVDPLRGSPPVLVRPAPVVLESPGAQERTRRRETLLASHSGLQIHCTKSTHDLKKSSSLKRRNQRFLSRLSRLLNRSRTKSPWAVGSRRSLGFVTVKVKKLNPRTRGPRQRGRPQQKQREMTLGPVKDRFEHLRRREILPPPKMRMSWLFREPCSLRSAPQGCRPQQEGSQCAPLPRPSELCPDSRKPSAPYSGPGRNQRSPKRQPPAVNDRKTGLQFHRTGCHRGRCVPAYGPHSLVSIDYRDQKNIRKYFPDVRVRAYDVRAHLLNQARCARLGKADWPNIAGRPQWPSHPTFCEKLTMLRTGRTCHVELPPVLSTRVGKRELDSNPDLLKRIIANEIVGIRSDCDVPEKFLGHFRYRQGFLILTGHHCLPIGLARYLAGKWTTAPYDLWSRRSLSFKQYLRKVPAPLVERSREELRVPDWSDQSDSEWGY